MIKEVFQHPSQVGRPSFPAKGPDDFRPYVRDSILKYEMEDEEGLEEVDYVSEWEEEPLPEGASLLADDEDADEDINTADILEEA